MSCPAKSIVAAAHAVAYAACLWSAVAAPQNWANFRCFDDPVFDVSANKTPPFEVVDARFTDSVVANLTAGRPALLAEGVKFFGEKPKGSIVLEANNWDTHYLSTFVAAILLQERVGYRVSVLQAGGAGASFARMYTTNATAASQNVDPSHVVHANVEVWPFGKEARIADHTDGNLNLGILGAHGRSGLYLNSAFVREMENEGLAVDHWRALRQCQVLSRLENNITSSAAGVHCLTSGHVVPQCNQTNGIYRTDACANGGAAGASGSGCLTSQCGASSSAVHRRNACATLTMMDPQYDPGLAQQLTNNLGLSVRMAFLGYSGALEHIKKMLAVGKPVFFYHWEPDIFHVEYEGEFTRVAFPPPTRNCTSRSTGDPSGGVDCDFHPQAFTKFSSANLAWSASGGVAALHLLKGLELTQQNMEQLLLRYKIERDNGVADSVVDGPHFRAACGFLRANPALWTPWVEAAIASSQAVRVPIAVDRSTPVRVPIVVAISSVFVVLLVIVMVSQVRHRRLQRFMAMQEVDASDLMNSDEKLLTPTDNLKRKLRNAHLRSVFFAVLEMIDLVTDLIAWIALLRLNEKCVIQLDPEVDASSIACRNALVSIYSFFAVAAVASGAFGLFDRRKVQMRMRKLYKQGFSNCAGTFGEQHSRSFHEAQYHDNSGHRHRQEAGGTQQDSNQQNASPKVAMVGRRSVQARYEVVRLRLRSLQRQMLSLFTESIPFIVINLYILIVDERTEASLPILYSLCTSLLSCGYKLAHAGQLRDTLRKRDKLRTILTESGVAIHPVRDSILPHTSSLSRMYKNPMATVDETGSQVQDDAYVDMHTRIQTSTGDKLNMHDDTCNDNDEREARATFDDMGAGDRSSSLSSTPDRPQCVI